MRFTESDIEDFRGRLQAGWRGRPSSQSARADGAIIGQGLPPDAEDALESIPELARRLVSAQYAALAVMDDSGRVVRFLTAGISREQREAIGKPPEGRGLLGALRREGRPIRIPDISSDPRSVGFPPNHPPMKSFLGVPIMLHGVGIGNLYLTNKLDAEEFTERDEQIVVTLARYVALAVENSRLYAQEAELRRRAEQEHARLRAIIDSTAAAVLVVEGTDGRVLLANHEASRLLGLRLGHGDPRERYDRGISYLRPDGLPFNPEDLPLERALRQGTTSRGVEAVLQLEDGRKVPVMMSASPVQDSSGAIAAAVVVFEDITAIQQVERLKADFLSMISHDLKGPLATIKGLASSILMDTGPRDASTILQYVSSIDEETDRMTELVGNLLDMSRIEAGAMPLDQETCHLADIVAESVGRIERSRLGGRHQISVSVPLELPEIYADYDQISRVIYNLLSNAIKYSPDGTEIAIRSYLSANDPGVIITEVRDQGIGIPENEKDKLFTKFYRVTSQRGRGRPGSGLGLAICKAIVSAHDGKIWVESEVGKGSTFFFSLPVAVIGVGYD